MTIELPKRTREDMLREWDEDYHQYDREAIAQQLLTLQGWLQDKFVQACNEGWDDLASELEYELRMVKLAKCILAFDPDVGE